MAAKEAVSSLLHKLSKAKTNEIPALLLTIEDLLVEHDNKVIKLLLWDNEILSTLTDILQVQDFGALYLSWDVAAQLCALLAKCCVGFTQPPDFRVMFLPLVVDRIMRVGANIQALEAPSAANFKVCMECVYWLIEYCPVLATALLHSDRLLQMLMSEGDPVVDQCILRLLKIALLALNSVEDIDQEKLLNLFDELMFKLYSRTCHMSVQQMCADVISRSARKHPTIKRMMLEYDADTSLSALSTGGVHDNISHMINFVKKCREEEAEAERLNLSAAKIQSHYRGYATRKKLRETSQKISRFQLKYREYLKEKKEKEIATKEENFEKELVYSKARERRKTHLIEQAVQIQATPANQLHKHQHQVRSTAASRVQAAWRMYRARRVVGVMKQFRVENRAAVLIQRAFRKHRGEERSWGHLPPGLTADKVVTLNHRIQELLKREEPDSPTLNHRIQELLKREEPDNPIPTEQEMLQSQDLYLKYTNNLNNIRRVQKRRENLCSQVSDQISALAKAPSLDKCELDDVRVFTCYDPVLVEEARRNHRACVSSKSNHRVLDYRRNKPCKAIELTNVDIRYSPLTYTIQQLD